MSGNHWETLEWKNKLPQATYQHGDAIGTSSWHIPVQRHWLCPAASKQRQKIPVGNMTEKTRRWTAAQSEENSTQHWFGDMAQASAIEFNIPAQGHLHCLATQYPAAALHPAAGWAPESGKNI